ncbi:MAG: ArsR/SmtB family transcription factor [Acetatifactor sp.]
MEGQNTFLHADKAVLDQIEETMPPEEELQDLAEFFKVFGDATRLKILYVLMCSEMCVYDIAAALGMTQSAISHQLRFLKQLDLVKYRRDGKIIYYSLSDAHIVNILNQGLVHIEE